MENTERNIKSALEDAGMPYYPGREYRLAKPKNVARLTDNGWKSLAFLESRPEEPMVVMEKVDEE